MVTLTLRPGNLLQSTFDKVGAGKQYDTVLFSDGTYTVQKPLKLNSGTTLTGTSAAILKLASYVSTSVFPAMTPIFGQKDSSISNILIENITFDGNYLKQSVQHGKGYHNFIGFTNGSNIELQNLTIKASMGDGARLKQCTTVNIHDCKVYGVGHDGFYCEYCTGVKAKNNTIYTRIDSGLRVRGCKDVEFAGNNIYSNDKYAPRYAPGMIIENSEDGETASNHYIHDNYIEGCFGFGIWVIGRINPDPNAASGIRIELNTIVDCGNMPSGADNVQAVGGIAVNGWTGVILRKNVIQNCHGYGILIGDYVSTSAGKGYTAELIDNVIEGTQGSNYPAGKDGIDYANKLPDKYAVTFSTEVVLPPTPEEIIGENCAVIITCDTPEQADQLSSAIDTTMTLDPAEYSKQIYYNYKK